MRRGEIYTVAGSGDFAGKPRPGLIVQSDLFNEFHPSVTVCPVSSTLTSDRIYRISVLPNAGNGLKWESEIEVDKVQLVWPRRLGRLTGRLSIEVMAEVDVALRRWMAL